ncbi:family 43 glycosylhydrolase [Actinotalea sp. Marseille-Q4924]|uniref:family 43 glycosylhydrolase n=1 Tax=Actinotalea sp. Marseille-Q4924 TaxID=2866571 RepID=UPI001CE437A6|nr:family 43 glycosylhydrolase [Actinotalea sp. Marseille-Q4924]
MRPNRAVPAVTGVAVVVGLALLTPPAVAAPPDDGSTPGGRGSATSSTTYTNPVSEPFADTFADPAVIRGKDGYWYAYGTTDPLFEGEGQRHLLPISRSTDLVTWEYVGDAFTEDTLPDWADTERNAALWAPDIRYVDGEYRLYYVVTETTVTPEHNDNAIGVATAPTPVGPWTDSGEPVVPPRRVGPDNFLWTFDPSHVVDSDGTEHLFYGSYYGGIYVTELSEDGTRAVGAATQVAIDNKYEGAYVIHRDGYWYLFVSSANCCAGPTTGYSVHVGRSESLTGPYVDREGVPLLQSRAGGTPVLAPNGNAFVGTGHNAIVTDLAGQDWNVYHAIDRADPYLDGTGGINERPMLMDRLDWIDGWPTTRAGLWASDDAQPGPVTGGRAMTSFDDGITRPFTTTGTWTTADDEQAGTHAVSTSAGTLLTRHALPYDVRVEADVRLDDGASSVGLVAAAAPRGDQIRATVDAATSTLVVEVLDRRGAVVTSGASPIPADVDLTAWTSAVLEVRDGQAYAELSHARLNDPFASVTVDLPAGTRFAGSAGAHAGGAGAHVDNLSALPASEVAVDEVAAPPAPGALLDGDEFEGDAPNAGWTAVRDPDVTVADGALRWVVESTDLVGGGNNAGLLLRDAPEGDWVAETKLTIDLGTDTIRNYQQGGIIAYVDDDRFARLSHVAIWNTRQTEFGYEIPYADRLQYGGTIIGPPSDTTWLRLTRTTDAAGEQEVQASTSTDGETWVHGGVWTFPADADIRIGLLAHGNQGGDPATAEFDYLRVHGTAG